MARWILALLLAVAMNVAPFGMRAMAAMPQQGSHCGPAQGHGGHGGKADPQAAEKDCCAAMCVGVALAPAVPPELPGFAQAVPRPAPAEFHRDYLARLPTPPPRAA